VDKIYIFAKKSFKMEKKYHVDLTICEREKLEDIVKRRKSSSEAVKRSQILLSCDRNGDKNWRDDQISLTYQVSRSTVERLRKRYVEHGLELALKGLPRLNLDKIKFDGEVEARLVSLRCSEPPVGSSRWTLKMLGDKLVSLEVVESISLDSVDRILKKTKLNLGGSKNG
jgi:transposase